MHRLPALTRLLCVLFLASPGLLVRLRADPPASAAELRAAVARVEAIVNQPVPEQPIGDQDHPALFQPGWFHPGAAVPDFERVDVRASQDCGPYAKWTFVTSDLNPGVMFPGAAVAFNPATKFFYTDRTRPKKKLSEDEMVEVNGLYRVIGRCLREIREAQAKAPGGPGLGTEDLGRLAPLVAASSQSRPAPMGAPASLPVKDPETGHRAVLAGVAIALAGLLVWVRARARRA